MKHKQLCTWLLSAAALCLHVTTMAQTTAAEVDWTNFNLTYEEETGTLVASDKQGLIYIGSYLKDGQNFKSSSFEVAIGAVALDADIDYAGNTTSITLNIPFDGRGHTIKNIGGPLFKTIGTEGEVYNLIVTSEDDYTQTLTPYSFESIGGIYFGGIALQNKGIIRECIINNRVELDVATFINKNHLTNVDSNEDIYYGLVFGGVAGLNEGTIENCLVANSVEDVRSYGNTVNGLPQSLLIANIAGKNNGTIANTFLTHKDKYNSSFSSSNTYNLLQVSQFDLTVSSIDETDSIPSEWGIGYVVGSTGTGTIRNVVVDDGGHDAPDLTWVNKLSNKEYSTSWSETDGGKEYANAMSNLLTDVPWATADHWPNSALDVVDQPELWTFTSSVYESTDSEGNSIFRRPIPIMGNKELESIRASILYTGCSVDAERGILYISGKTGWQAAFQDDFMNNEVGYKTSLVRSGILGNGTDSVTYICTSVTAGESGPIYKGVELRGIVLECDLDFTDNDRINIGNLKSKHLKDFTFDGRGHFITGGVAKGENPMFMYYLPEGCTVKNLGLINSSMTFNIGNQTEPFANAKDESGHTAWSPFIGVNHGTIENCWIESTDITIGDTYHNTMFGGMVGYNYGTLKSVRTSVGLTFSVSEDGTVYAIDDTPSIAIGGVVGYNGEGGTIDDVFISEEGYTTQGSSEYTSLVSIRSNMECTATEVVGNISLSAGLICGDWISKEGVKNVVVSTEISDATSVSTSDTQTYTCTIGGDTYDWYLTASDNIAVKEPETLNDWEYSCWKDEALSLFTNPTKWTFTGAYETMVKDIYPRRPVPTLRSSSLDFSLTDDGIKQVAASDSTSFLDLMNVLADPYSTFFNNAVCTIPQDILFSATEVDMDTLTANGVLVTYANMPNVDTLSTVIDGNGSTISNMVCNNTGGMFSNVTEGGSFGNLLFENATLVVDPSNEAYKYNEELGCTVINIFADQLGGSLNNIGFAGNVIFDETNAPASGGIALSLANELTDGAELSGFLYLEDVLTGNNSTETDTKRCLTIKQNMGAASKGSTAKAKVALSKSSDTKSLETIAFSNLKSVNLNKYNYSQEELEKNEREFTAEEFASGAVAYWLNWSDKGYTGVYTGKWAQGPKYPIPASNTEGSAAGTIQMVTYEVDNATLLTAAPAFCNTGSNLVIEYAEQPKFIKYGNDYVTLGATSATISFTDPSKKVVISFNTKALNNVASDANIRIATNGKTISILGAEGQMAQLVNLSGAVVAQSNSGKLTAPAGGVYLLKVGNMSWRVGVK